MEEGKPAWEHWQAVNVMALRDGIGYAPMPPGNPAGRKSRDILNVCCAFDIETTRLPDLDQAFCYHWQFQYGPDRPTIYGRELWEFRKFLDGLQATLGDRETLYIFVHNLSYEFHFLRGVYPEIDNKDVFSVKPRKPIKVKLYDGKIELRCSYILTNMGLDTWTAKMQVEHGKLSGAAYDYTKIRYPWTPLTDLEKQYCRNDVLGLVEALQRQLDVYGDTLATLVLTSTGYVRRDVKRCMRQWSWKALQNLQPTAPVYLALRAAFRGGNAHASRFYTGKIIPDVGSMDRSSSYPDVCCNRPFPMGKFQRSLPETKKHLDKLRKEGRAILLHFYCENLRLRDEWNPCPYISYSKIEGPKEKYCETDNGRILYAPWAEMTVTDLDLDIIEKDYKWDNFKILDMWDTRYGELPNILRALIIKYYRDKTRLKGVEGEEVYYDKAKALLNSIYGLQAQDPCKADTIYNPDPDAEHDLFMTKEGDILAKLMKSRRQPYTGYQIGVWVCAWA